MLSANQIMANTSKLKKGLATSKFPNGIKTLEDYINTNKQGLGYRDIGKMIDKYLAGISNLIKRGGVDAEDKPNGNSIALNFKHLESDPKELIDLENRLNSKLGDARLSITDSGVTLYVTLNNKNINDIVKQFNLR